MMSFIVIAEDR